MVATTKATYLPLRVRRYSGGKTHLGSDPSVSPAELSKVEVNLQAEPEHNRVRIEPYAA